MEHKKSFEPKYLFEVINDEVRKIAQKHGEKEPQAFIRWFIEMYFLDPRDIFISDGPRDGKFDAFFTSYEDDTPKQYVINSKYTTRYSESAPGDFYEELTYLWQAFNNKPKRNSYLQKAVKAELRPYYQTVFEHYDNGNAGLVFLTNHVRNDPKMILVPEEIQVFHLDELIQYMVDDIDMAMPRTPSLILSGIPQVLTPGENGIELSTSIVFARLIDFIQYMQKDTFGLLFARNVRFNLGNTEPNTAIKETFENAPDEFAFSNNGITVICEKYTHDPSTRELTLENPRVVNGSQTLHSVQEIANPSETARVMVRIIRIPPLTRNDLAIRREQRKDLIKKIALRTNLQNPIRKSDLVANDDFQLDVFRYFWKRKFFYECRRNEWKARSRELKSAGLKRGPDVDRLIQLMACYYPTDRRFGPAIAKGNRNKLFAPGAYEDLSKTSPSIAYQLYLLNLKVNECYKKLSRRKKYIKNLKGHSEFALFALVIATLKAAHVPWGNEKWTRCLEASSESRNICARWEKLTKGCIDEIREYYLEEAAEFRANERKNLFPNNYFKNQSYVAKIFNSPIPASLVKLAETIAQSAK